MPKFRDSVSIVRRIIKRYRGSKTCNGQTQFGSAKTQTKIGISMMVAAGSMASLRTNGGIVALNHTEILLFNESRSFSQLLLLIVFLFMQLTSFLIFRGKVSLDDFGNDLRFIYIKFDDQGEKLENKEKNSSTSSKGKELSPSLAMMPNDTYFF